MATYTVKYLDAAVREFSRLPRDVQAQVRKKIDALAANPRPAGATALQGKLAGYLRIRSGNYRVVYSVEDRALVVQSKAKKTNPRVTMTRGPIVRGAVRRTASR